MNSNKNEKGISFDLWMNGVTKINIDKIENNKPRKQMNVNDNDDDDKNDNEVSEEESKHIMTVLKCIDNVWKSLGAGHRESAYQKALMYDLIDNGYRIEMEKRIPVYHYTRNRKKIYLVSMERIDLFIKYPSTVIEMKAVSSKLSVKDEYQAKKYSRNRKKLSFLVNCPNNRDDTEVKCWIIDENDEFVEHDIEQYQQ